MKNITTILLTLGLIGTSAILMTTPAFADAAFDRRQRESNDRQQESFKNQQNQRINDSNQYKYTPAPSQPSYKSPSNTSSPTYQPSSGSSSGSYSSPSSSSYDGSGLDGLGALFGLFNYGPSAISTNGIVQYGVQSKFGFENIRVRTGAHFGGGGSALNGGFTVGFGGESAMLNPFVGGGLGYKSFTVNKIESSAFSFYGTGGIDLNLSQNFSITGAVNIPTNSEYGTEYQVGINLFGF
jgi:hypothetical protein